MRVPYNYLDRQFDATPLTGRILARLGALASRGDFTLGREVAEFESAWAELVGTKHAIGCSNGTDAIAVALQAAGLQPGEEVLTSPVSFIATTGAIIQAGGKPVFTDVDRVDAPNIAHFDGTQYDWVVPVLWAGNLYGIEWWHHKNGPKLVVDAAQAVNGRFVDQKIGDRLKDAYAFCYSLHPLKNVHGWADGGVIATNDAAVDDASRSLRNHGLKGRDLWEQPGYNHRMSTVEATMVLEVLNDYDTMAARRAENALLLDEAVDRVDGLMKPYVEPGTGHAYHLYQIIVDGDRQAFLDYLVENGVEAKVHYPIPFHLQPAMRPLEYARGDFPIAEQFCDQHVSVPIHEYLTGEEVAYMCSVIEEWQG
tara:strand:- start:26 stop:1126 length:1101 start_codon:yes stop_codon:yes gene_type:complete